MRTKDLDKQQRIKEAMVRLILQEGIDGTSVAKIARAAGVSPATIYVYYSSKEEMLTEIFREYSRRPYQYLLREICPQMSAGDLIENIVRGWYRFSAEYEDVFSFVEQCSRCPSISSIVCEQECCGDILDLIHGYQQRGQLRIVSDRVMGAMLFAPVRFLAVSRRAQEEADEELSELIRMLQTLLLI